MSLWEGTAWASPCMCSCDLRATNALHPGIHTNLRCVCVSCDGFANPACVRTNVCVRVQIIPYVASQFRKDKIWLRRTKPSKRQYHVVVAIDNSRSMRDTSARAMACEAMATICKAMTKLEVGDISVLSFGDTVDLLHPLGKPFTAEAGASVLSRFSFNHESTRIADSLEHTLAMLGEAKHTMRDSAIRCDHAFGYECCALPALLSCLRHDVCTCVCRLQSIQMHANRFHDFGWHC
jgi:hypothetical protein